MCEPLHGGWSVCCRRMGVGACGEEIVLRCCAEVLRSRCVVLCTGVSFVSDWHGHVGGWEGSMARRSRKWKPTMTH